MIQLFLKGIAMGICDLIPGISGGTIAFITGIYERLMIGVKNLYPKQIWSKKGWVTYWNNIDFAFFIPLGLGILLAIITTSHIVDYLLEHYFGLMMSFFVGIIVASAMIMYKEVLVKQTSEYLFILIGFILGILVSLLTPTQLSGSPPILILSGFLAISALFLPGISGSYILLLLGQYHLLLNIIQAPFKYITELFSLGIGMVIGAYIISKIVAKLFKQHKKQTILLLIGLVIGALLLPLQQISQVAQLSNLIPYIGGIALPLLLNQLVK